MIESAQIFEIAIPLKLTIEHALKTSQPRSLAENIVFTLQSKGFSGVGEAVPRIYVTGETPETAFRAIKEFDLKMLDECLSANSFSEAVQALERLALPDRLVQGGKPGLAAACAIELAVLDLLGKKFKASLCQLPDIVSPNCKRNKVSRFPFSYFIRVSDSLENYKETFAPNTSIERAKVTIGRDREWDYNRIKDVRRQFGSDIEIWADVNRHWSLEDALVMVERLQKFNVSWYEEPLPDYDFDGHRKIREVTGARIALDESVCTLKDAAHAISTKSCDLFNVRISKCGGLLNAIKMTEIAQRNNINYYLGGQIGQAQVIAAADWIYAQSIDGIKGLEGWNNIRNLTTSIVAEEMSPTLRPDDWSKGLSSYGLGVHIHLSNVQTHARQAATWERNNAVWF